MYPPGYFESFQPEKTFVKWAALQVVPNHEIPSRIEKIIIESGLYAVFHYKGLSNDAAIFRFIFNSWLPGSEYQLAARPHMELLGKKYRNNDPHSEEEIWIPIEPKP